MTSNPETAGGGMDLEALRRREVQMMGAAISTRSWHDMENAYNQLRDKVDAELTRRTIESRSPSETAEVEPVALKDCPFCGGKAYFAPVGNGIWCDGCEVEMHGGPNGASPNENWNRRPPAARADGEAVRKIAIASAYAQGFVDGTRAEGDDPDVGESFAAYMATSTYTVTATTRPFPETSVQKLHESIAAEQAPERVERKSGEGWTIGEVLAEMLAVAVASLECEEDDPLLEDWPVDCRADVDRWQCVIRDALKVPDHANCAVGEELRNRLVEAADNAGAFDPGEAVVSIDDAIRAALAAMPTSEAIRADERGRVVAIMRDVIRSFQECDGYELAGQMRIRLDRLTGGGE